MWFDYMSVTGLAWFVGGGCNIDLNFVSVNAGPRLTASKGLRVP